MKVDSSLKKGFIYLLLAIVPIVVSVIYGQLMVSNIGHFSDYGEIVFNLGLTGIIVIPVVVTIYYIGLVIFGSKSGLIKWNIQQFSYILIFLAILAYMAFITFTSDIRGSCNPGYVANHEVATLDERLWGFLSFYLGILSLYNIFCLIKPVKGFKQAIVLFCLVVLIFDLVMIAYSLMTEWDKYVNFEWFDDLYDKPSLDKVIKSFFPIANVYGHYLYFGIISLITLSFVFRKYYLALFSLLLLPFIFYSNCRIALVGSFVLYGCYFIYLWIRSFKYSRILFYILTGVIVLACLIVAFDFYGYNFIKFEMENGSEVSLKKLVFDLWETFLGKRLGIIDMIPVTTNNIIFGFGYGNQFIIPRTYGYYYYFHNAVYEIFMAGGLPYFIFTAILFLIVFVKLLKVAKRYHKYNYLGLFLVLLVTQSIYGLFESHVTIFNDLTGSVLSVFILCIPNICANFELNGRKYLYFNSEIQKTCLNLSYEQLYTIAVTEDVQYQNVISFVQKLVFEFSLDSSYKFIVTYDPRVKNIGDSDVKLDKEEKVLYVSFK